MIHREYTDGFKGGGYLKVVYKIEIHTSVKPVKSPKRKVPIA